jgi:hypothetical protein
LQYPWVGVLHQLDVKTVLLNKVIEEEAYVEQPQGFEVYQKETHECKMEEDLVWIQATWCSASHVHQKRGENFL